MILIIKGFIVGIGKILPGVSGAMLAISLGIYEEIIDIISNLKNITKEKTIYIIKVSIGISLAIILTSKIIVKCISNYYLPTILLFVGIIIGGIIKIIKQTKFKKKEIISSIILLILILLIIKYTNINTINVHKIEYTIIEFIKIILIGILDALSSIVPGISGTALLLTLGYYNIIIESFSTLLEINYIKKNIFVLIPFIIGFVIGIIEISKIINKIIKKNKNTINVLAIIFMTITTIILIKNTIVIQTTKIQKIIGITLLIAGINISKYIEKT